MSHHPAHKTRALDRYDPEFRKQAEDLFERVKDRVGEERAVRFMGSYSIRAYSRGATTPLSFVKIIIREDFPPDTYVDEAGVYVLIRADDWMAGWLDREPWTRVDFEQTIRIISVLFYGVRLGGRYLRVGMCTSASPSDPRHGTTERLRFLGRSARGAGAAVAAGWRGLGKAHFEEVWANALVSPRVAGLAEA